MLIFVEFIVSLLSVCVACPKGVAVGGRINQIWCMKTVFVFFCNHAKKFVGGGAAAAGVVVVAHARACFKVGEIKFLYLCIAYLPPPTPPSVDVLQAYEIATDL